MNYSRADVIEMLHSRGTDAQKLYLNAVTIRNETIGDGIYLRGLIEYSNVCSKNCYYCGIRSDSAVERYTLSFDDALAAARFAWENNYGSIAIQAGENRSPAFTRDITRLISAINEMTGGRLGITLSLGEQSESVYREWFAAGAHRYLLRIESADRPLYAKLHPEDGNHGYDARLSALDLLCRTGYQVGTGVMIGLPFQSVENLAADLLFISRTDVVMCGMGPYIVSKDTPLARYAHLVPTADRRLRLSLNMIAALRHLMPDINIASTTALQTIHPDGRLMGIEAGANVIMPNITPARVRSSYSLYDDKAGVIDSRIMEKNVRYGVKGDSKRFRNRSET